MEIKHLLATALAATLLLSTTATAKPKHLDLGNKDNRQSFTVHKGEEIDVRLSGEQTESAVWGWTAPTAADTSMIHRDVARTSPTGDTTAVFHARADGTTTIDSQFRCVSSSPGHACSTAVVPWQVTVAVRR